VRGARLLQNQLAFSLEFGAGGWEDASVKSGGPSSHHVLAAVRRVGLPAVLEVVGELVVPVVLLLRPVGLQLLRRRRLEGHQVLSGAGQQLLQLVVIVLGLQTRRRAHGREPSAPGPSTRGQMFLQEEERNSRVYTTVQRSPDSLVIHMKTQLYLSMNIKSSQDVGYK